MKIQRYDNNLRPDDDGFWVKYEDIEIWENLKILHLRQLLRDNGINPDSDTFEDEEDVDSGPDPADICKSLPEFLIRLENFVKKYPGAKVIPCDLVAHRLIGACGYIVIDDQEILCHAFLPLTAIQSGYKLNTIQDKFTLMRLLEEGEIFSDKCSRE